MGSSIQSPNTNCYSNYYAISEMVIYDKTTLLTNFKIVGLAEIVWFQ
jgi:hypothetical protein